MGDYVALGEWLRSLPVKWFGRAKRLAQDPWQAKFAFMGPKERIRACELDEYDAWYSGKSSDLLNVYSYESAIGFWSNPIYNRNKQNMFWAVSSKERDVKRTHSGFPRDMLTAMADRIGVPEISSSDPDAMEAIADLTASGDLTIDLVKKHVPLVFAEGTGALKPVYDRRLGRFPKLEFYGERDLEMIPYNGHVVGVAFKDYYVKGGDKYTLLDVRHVSYDPEEDEYYSVVEYFLFKGFGWTTASAVRGDDDERKKWGKDRDFGTGRMVPLSTLPQTEGLKPFEIKGCPFPLAIPLVFTPDPDRFGYGVSQFANKIDIFDDLDQAYSVMGITTRRSTPIEYVDPQYLERDKDGNPILPKSFDRKYIALGNTSVNGNGDIASNVGIRDTQPDLRTDLYLDQIEALKIDALGTFMSPASLGIGVSRKDNQGMQREKEKMTFISRDNFVNSLIPAVRRAVVACVAMKTYADGGVAKIVPDKDISVTFGEFSSPTLETKANTLVPMLVQGAISPEAFVEMFWENGMDADEKRKQAEWIRNVRFSGLVKNPGNAGYPKSDALQGNGSDLLALDPQRDGERKSNPGTPPNVQNVR